MSDSLASPAGPRATVQMLLRKLRRGIDREESFRKIFDIYYPRIRGGFRRVPTEDREDLTQEVFLRVSTRLERCPEDVQGFERWLAVVAQNVLRSWFTRSQRLKRRGREVPVVDGAVEGSAGMQELKNPRDPPQGAALEQLLVGERARMLHQAISRMPEQMRACISLRVGQSRSHREIASLLGLAEGTVKAHLNHAREWLRSELGPYFEDFEP